MRGHGIEEVRDGNDPSRRRNAPRVDRGGVTRSIPTDMVSSAWSPYPDHVQAPKLAATIGLGLVFAWAASRADARRLTRAGCLAAFCVLAALLTVEAIADLALNRAVRPEAPDWVLEGNPTRGAVILLALTWAVAGGLSVWGAGA